MPRNLISPDGKGPESCSLLGHRVDVNFATDPRLLGLTIIYI